MSCKIPSRKQAEEFFNAVDVSNDGKVSPMELLKHMESMGCTSPEVASIMTDIDKDGDNLLSLKEFLDEVLKDPRAQALEEAFAQMDSDGSQKIDLDEAKKGAQAAGLTDVDIIVASFEEMDGDGSGKVDKEEFLAYMNNKY